MWGSAEAVVRAVRSGGDGLTEDFDPDDPAHEATLRALPHDALVSIIALLGGPAGLRRRFPNTLAMLAQKWAMGGRATDALKLFDALVACDHQETGAYGVALWAVQDDNTHLGVDEPRARRYLKCCLPYGKKLPDIYFNAMFVCLELGDIDSALKHLTAAIRGGFAKDVARTQLQTEKLCASVRKDPRFLAVVA